ncbi:DUF2530 domain-containing protein [Krasilnikoviella flava]|uniref:DUF2530 domain-containing protein n=1 Tax=Krasilnikoviella flava TaxID=526729 RepID=A0A1T5IIN1_9MICO|nr:DUF2530 domain-containing protein [Krasilnikoviella flava]SKC38997.1 Protein of unknown function [Krasilnikoviella flava]
MPSIVRMLTHPEERRPGPPPLRVDLRRVVLGGIGLWVVALVATLVVYLTGRGTEEAVVTCVAGILLGGAGLLWERKHRSEYRGED